jgi:hypothetical protein
MNGQVLEDTSTDMLENEDSYFYNLEHAYGVLKEKVS